MKEKLLTTKNCWEIKGCPASFYLNCKAYAERVSCWKIKDGCMCLSDENCDKCSVYKDYTKTISVDAKKSRN